MKKYFYIYFTFISVVDKPYEYRQQLNGYDCLSLIVSCFHKITILAPGYGIHKQK